MVHQSDINKEGSRVTPSFLAWKTIYTLRQKERELSICCSPYLCIHWLILVCAFTRDRTCNLGVLGQCSNQLSYRDRALGNCIYFQRFYLFIFREREKEGERQGGKHQCVGNTWIGCLLHTPSWRRSLQPRHVL
ncbi:hypothetical protein HJG60_010966 [Phyllostomus discolor]|uniref:Uncharacterized protein n=1 Tax=Phyllostomus discolor TaxID=89673 RepID=A0A834ADW3_9CHIR|nr:hypothetical protein HJG60_010966 [Phyllostomus discolor]